MFDFFKKAQSPKCPIPEERRQWLEQAFGWLVHVFGEEPIRTRRVLLPHHSDFPIRYNGEKKTARHTIDIIARQMEIDPLDIELFFYKDGVQKISTGSPLGTSLFTSGNKAKTGTDRYLARETDGKYHIGLEENKLVQPEFMVATLTHDLSLIKLQDLDRPQENTDQLTELTAIVFGLGIFNANATLSAFQDLGPTAVRNSGCLSQMDWGYAMAFFARFRKEDNPEWSNYLCKNVKADFLKSRRYLSA